MAAQTSNRRKMCDIKSSDISKLKWMHYSSTLYTAQMESYENNNASYDVVLVSSDGKHFKTHKIVLSSCSDFFHTILHDVPAGITPTVYLPDADSTVLECLLLFVYAGESSVKSAYLTKLLDLCQYLQIKGFITHNYSVNGIKVGTFDETTNASIKDDQIEEDFSIEYLDCADVDETYSDEAELEDMLDSEENDNYTHLAIERNEPVNKTNMNVVPKSKAKRSRSTYSQMSRNMHSEFDVALSELSKGKTIHQLSIEYNLPRSTLYQKFRSNESLKQNYRSERRSALDQAVRCVMDERLSLKKASDRYNLPKTAIWRELRKYHHYQPPTRAISQERQNAQDEILTGKSLTSISNKYGIPLTTLHRDKKRLSSEGKLPELLRVRDRTENSDYGKRLEEALQKCRQGMSQYQAARKFNIPKATMWRHAHVLFKVDGKCELPNTTNIEVATENESD